MKIAVYTIALNESDPQVFTTCVQCGQGEYELVNEVKLDGPVIQ